MIREAEINDELIERVAKAIYGDGADRWRFLTEHQRDVYRSDARRVLAVVRAHDAPASAGKRVPVQIVIDGSEGSPVLIALANDHTIHQGWWEGGKFAWRDGFPPLPQGDEP